MSSNSSKKSWRKVGSNLVKNLMVSLWLIVVYYAVNYCLAKVVELFSQPILSLELSLLLLMQIMILLTFTATLAVLYFLPKLIFKPKSKLYQELNFDWKKTAFGGWLQWKHIGLGLSGFVLALILRVILLVALQRLLPGFDIEQRQDLGFEFSAYSPKFELAFVFFNLVVTAPVVEELIFRGYLFEKVRSRSNFAMTTLVVSLVFGLAHFIGGGWVAVVVTFALSVVMCMTREITKSIYPAIIIHAINNAIAFLALLTLIK